MPERLQTIQEIEEAKAKRQERLRKLYPENIAMGTADQEQEQAPSPYAHLYPEALSAVYDEEERKRRQSAEDANKPRPYFGENVPQTAKAIGVGVAKGGAEFVLDLPALGATAIREQAERAAGPEDYIQKKFSDEELEGEKFNRKQMITQMVKKLRIAGALTSNDKKIIEKRVKSDPIFREEYANEYLAQYSKEAMMNTAGGPIIVGRKAYDWATGKVLRFLGKFTQADDEVAYATKKFAEKNHAWTSKVLGPSKTGIEQTARDLTSGGLSVALSWGLTAVTKNPSAASFIFGGMQKLRSYEEARKSGMSPEEASAFSTTVGMGEALIEYVGLDMIFNRIPSKAIMAKKLAVAAQKGLKKLPWEKALPAVAKPVTSFASKALKRAFAQGAEEFFQSISEAGQSTAEGVKKFEGVAPILRQAAYEFLIGFLVSAPNSAITASYDHKLEKMGIYPNQRERMLSGVREAAKQSVLDATEDRDLIKAANHAMNDAMYQAEILNEFDTWEDDVLAKHYGRPLTADEYGQMSEQLAMPMEESLEEDALRKGNIGKLISALDKQRQTKVDKILEENKELDESFRDDITRRLKEIENKPLREELKLRGKVLMLLNENFDDADVQDIVDQIKALGGSEKDKRLVFDILTELEQNAKLERDVYLLDMLDATKKQLGTSEIGPERQLPEKATPEYTRIWKQKHTNEFIKRQILRMGEWGPQSEHLTEDEKAEILDIVHKVRSSPLGHELLLNYLDELNRIGEEAKQRGDPGVPPDIGEEPVTPPPGQPPGEPPAAGGGGGGVGVAPGAVPPGKPGPFTPTEIPKSAAKAPKKGRTWQNLVLSLGGLDPKANEGLKGEIGRLPQWMRRSKDKGGKTFEHILEILNERGIQITHDELLDNIFSNAPIGPDVIAAFEGDQVLEKELERNEREQLKQELAEAEDRGEAVDKKTLTKKLKEAIEQNPVDLLAGNIEEKADAIREKGGEPVVNIKGEEFKVQKTEGGVKLTDGKTIELDPWDKVAIDNGLVKVKKKTAPKDMLAEERDALRKEGPAKNIPKSKKNIGYSTHGKRDTAANIHAIESERGNVVDEILLQYPDAEAIWVTSNPEDAVHYSRSAELMDEDIPPTQSEIDALNEIDLTDGIHVESMDDGDGGELWIFPKSPVKEKNVPHGTSEQEGKYKGEMGKVFVGISEEVKKINKQKAKDIELAIDETEDIGNLEERYNELERLQQRVFSSHLEKGDTARLNKRISEMKKFATQRMRGGKKSAPVPKRNPISGQKPANRQRWTGSSKNGKKTWTLKDRAAEYATSTDRSGNLVRDNEEKAKAYIVEDQDGSGSVFYQVFSGDDKPGPKFQTIDEAMVWAEKQYLTASEEASEPEQPEKSGLSSQEILSKSGMKVSQMVDNSGKPFHIVTGAGTFLNRRLLKKLGAWKKFDKNNQGWRFYRGNPTEQIAEALRGRIERNPGGPGAGAVFSGEMDRKARQKIREREDARADERTTIKDLERFADTDTKAAIRKGRAAGIPDEILNEQIQDIQYVNRAYQTGKPMFVIASEPGSGKTFVLGGTIQQLKRAGAKRIAYVTMNQQLIEQIKDDLSDFDVAGVDFMTYAEVRKYEREHAGYDAVIFDESQSIKNLDSQQGGAANDMLQKSKFAVFSSATPFENPVEAQYLEPTGIFDSAGGFEVWSLAYGAAAKTLKSGQKIIYWPGKNVKAAKAARLWFEKQAIMSQRDIKVPVELMDVSFKKVKVSKEWSDLYNRAEFAFDGIGNSMKGLQKGMYKAYITNLKKRMLEAAKVESGVERAKEHLKAGRRVVIFVETKAERHIPVNRIVEAMDEYYREIENLSRFDEKPSRPYSSAVEMAARALKSIGIGDLVIPPTRDAIEKGLGKENVAIYTGEISDAASKKNLAAWRSGAKPVLVATMAKGGTGLSLHDKVGNSPVAQININLPWKASGVAQVAGRCCRYGMKSKAFVEWIFSDEISFDKELASRVAGRMADMGAVVKGIDSEAARMLDEWDFENERVDQTKERAQKQSLDTGNIVMEDIKRYAKSKGIPDNKLEQMALDLEKEIEAVEALPDNQYESIKAVFKGTATPKQIKEAFSGTDFLRAFVKQDVKTPPNFDPMRGALIDTPQKFGAWMIPLRNPMFECMTATFLDENNRVISTSILSVGIMNASLMHPLDLFGFKPDGAKKVIISHNHPSGTVMPSREDRKITAQIKALVDENEDIEWVDHIITDGDRVWSFESLNEYKFVDYMSHASEIIPQTGRKNFSGPEDLEPYVSALRKSAGVNISHIIYVDNGNKVVGVERIPSAFDMEQIRKIVVKHAGQVGAAGFLLDLQKLSTSEFKRYQALIQESANITFLDATTPDVPSFAVVAEERAPYGAEKPSAKSEIGKMKANVQIESEELRGQAKMPTKKIVRGEGNTKVEEVINNNKSRLNTLRSQLAAEQRAIDANISTEQGRKKAETLKAQIKELEGLVDLMERQGNLFEKPEDKSQTSMFSVEPGMKKNKDDSITITDFDAITPAQYAKINNYMRRKGYDWRGPDDAKELLQGLQKRTGKLKGDHADAVRYGTTVKKQTVWTKAKREFGLTSSYIEAGYILPDGDMLDFSEKREGGSPNMRSLDHREIGRVGGPGGTQGMQEFMAQGAIRIDGNGGAIDISAEPTTQQYKRLREYFYHAKQAKTPITLDLEKGLGEQRAGDEYNRSYRRTNDAMSKEYGVGENPAKILADIRQYYSRAMRQTESLVQKFHTQDYDTETSYAGETDPGTFLDVDPNLQEQIKRKRLGRPKETPEQRKRRLAARQKRAAQIDLNDVKMAKEATKEFIRHRRGFLDLESFKTMLFVHKIKERSTAHERELVPFLIEKTSVPEKLDREDLNLLYYDFMRVKKSAYNDDGTLKPRSEWKGSKEDKRNFVRMQNIVNLVEKHFNKGWEFMQENGENLSVDQIENYVTHIWNLSGKRNKAKREMLTRYFITKNRFLNKRYIETLYEGIQQFELTPSTLDIGDIIRIHDGTMNRVIANKLFVKSIKAMRVDGAPLWARSDSKKYLPEWETLHHPALQETLIVPGEPVRGEKVSDELKAILDEMGVLIGRRINSKVFGHAVWKKGEYRPATGIDPAIIRLQRFFETRTIAHEIGHHIDTILGLGDEWLDNFRGELLKVNQERIDLLASVGKRSYAASTEEQIAEFFAMLFTNPDVVQQMAPNAMADALERLNGDQMLSKLTNFDFENKAKILLEEQLNKFLKLDTIWHPDIAKYLKVIFDQRFSHPIINAYEGMNAGFKKMWLSASLFHHTALFETAVAIMGPIKTLKVANPVSFIIKGLVRGDNLAFKKSAIAKDAVEHLLQLGASSDIPIQRIQSALEQAHKTMLKIPIPKALNLPAGITYLVKEGNKHWDQALWSYMHDGFKLMAYEHMVGKLNPLTTENMDKAKIEIAQFINDTFGGQHWETLFMNPKLVQILHWGMLSPDWTISTMRQALAPTGVGFVHKELKGMRRKMGGLFWVRAAFYFGVAMNAFNYIMRRRDEKENPEFYKTRELSFIDYTMFGNSYGNKTYLFMGRNKDGTERYLRWGKQFRELPEMLQDPPLGIINRLGAKGAPVPQIVSQIATGRTLSGFENFDISDKKGWERATGVMKTLIRSAFPFSTRAIWYNNRDWRLTDLAFPERKGMTSYKAIQLFQIAIGKKNDRMMKEVYSDALENNLDAYGLFKIALSKAKSEQTKEIQSSVKNIEDARKKLRESKDPAERVALIRLIRTLNKRSASFQNGDQLLNRAIMDMNRFRDPRNQNSDTSGTKIVSVKKKQ